MILLLFFRMSSVQPPVQPRLSSQSTTPAATTTVEQTNKQEFSKLENDLINVHEKIKLCREMLQESPGIHEDEALAEVVGFLEACRDRMMDVIEAGTHGLLDEELFAKCLRVNDALLRTLDAEKVRATVVHCPTTLPLLNSVDKYIELLKTNILIILYSPTNNFPRNICIYLPDG